MSLNVKKGLSYSAFKDLDMSVREKYKESIESMKNKAVNDSDFSVLQASEAEKEMTFIDPSTSYVAVFYDVIRGTAVAPCNFSTFKNLSDKFYSVDLSKVDEKSPDRWLLTDSRFVFIYVYGTFNIETLEFKHYKKRLMVPVFNLLNSQSQLFALKAVKIDERTKQEVKDALEKEKDSLSSI